MRQRDALKATHLPVSLGREPQLVHQVAAAHRRLFGHRFQNGGDRPRRPSRLPLEHVPARIELAHVLRPGLGQRQPLLAPAATLVVLSLRFNRRSVEEFLGRGAQRGEHESRLFRRYVEAHDVSGGGGGGAGLREVVVGPRGRWSDGGDDGGVFQRWYFSTCTSNDSY